MNVTGTFDNANSLTLSNIKKKPKLFFRIIFTKIKYSEPFQPITKYWQPYTLGVSVSRGSDKNRTGSIKLRTQCVYVCGSIVPGAILICYTGLSRSLVLRCSRILC